MTERSHWVPVVSGSINWRKYKPWHVWLWRESQLPYLNLSHQLPTTHLQVCPWSGIIVELDDDWERARRPETGRKFNFSKICWKL